MLEPPRARAIHSAKPPRRTRLARGVQLLGASAVLIVGALSVTALAMGTTGCFVQCAAGCDSAVHMTIHGAANATKLGPALFEVCGTRCATYRFDGATCELVGSHNGIFCKMDGDALEFDVPINDAEKDFVFVNVRADGAAPGDKLLFRGDQDVDTTEFEVCGQTCYEADVEFTIPG